MPRGPSLSQRDRLNLYRDELDIAMRWRDNEGFDDLWRRCIDLYRNKVYPPGSLTAEHQLAIAVAFSSVNVIYPSVSVRYPQISVNPRRPDVIQQAYTVEQVINYYWRTYDFQEPFRQAVKDSLLIGHGWNKIGWKYVEENSSLDQQEWDDQKLQMQEQVRQFAQMQPELAGELPSDEEIEEFLEDQKTIVVDDRPFVERISPFNMFVPADAVRMDDARWVAQRIIRPLEDVQNDKRYSASARSSLKANLVLGKSATDRDRRKQQGVDRVSLIEFYDLDDGYMCLFPEGGDKYLLKPQPMPYAHGHPYELLTNYEVPDEFYPIGELEMLEPLQHELNATRSALMNNRRRYARKYLVREKALTDAAKSAITSDRDGELVPVSDDNTPLQDIVQPVPQVPMDAQLYGWGEQIMSDIREVSGVSEYARGTMPETRRTATEAAMIQDASNARSADKLAIVENFASRIARKVVQVTQQFLTGEQVVRITGPDGAAGWQPYDRQSIQGEFDFLVEAGSTQPMNESFRRMQAEKLAAVAAPFVQMGIVNPVELAAHLLREGFNIKDPERFLQQQAPPLPGEGPQGGEVPPEGGSGDRTDGLDAGPIPPEMLREIVQGGATV